MSTTIQKPEPVVLAAEPPQDPPPSYNDLPEVVPIADGRAPSTDPSSVPDTHPPPPASSAPPSRSASMNAPIPVVTLEPRTATMSASVSSYNPQNPRGLKTQPIYALQGYSSCVECPGCGHVGLTRVEKVSGSKTHLWAGLACVLCCCPCVPYLVDSCKDTHHFCKECTRHIFSYKN
ncbi:LITAF-like zinc ribbon domain-containing protein [Geopyxis carbonaria]|nr:LITAF-like zinc ribbon domain-containing protein [Geopyxis carbonaria]